MGVVDGFLAAAAGPGLVTVGFFLWDHIWTGSGVVLNAFKGLLAGSLFLLVLVGRALFEGEALLPAEVAWQAVGALWLSSMLGIVIGDTLWLVALARLGARRVILLDATKPFLAAVVAALALGEQPSAQVLLGMVITVSGVLLVALEEEAEQHRHKEEDKGFPRPEHREDCKADALLAHWQAEGNAETPKILNDAEATPRTVISMRSGYVCAAVNCTFDVIGNVLTKRFGSVFNTFQINVLRFGFAGVVLAMLLLAIALGCKAFGRPVPEWCQIPGDLKKRQWALLSAAVFFVTFCSPTLTQYAIFQIDLACYVTLISLGPVWALPIGYLVKREHVSLRALGGSLIAVIGVVPLAMSYA